MHDYITENGNRERTQKGLINYLYDYCFEHRNPKAFYLSRTFHVVDAIGGKSYYVSLTFDRDEILTNVKFTPINVNNDRPTLHHPYRLFSTNFVDCEGLYFDTNTQVFEYLKAHEGKKFTLQINGGERVWTWYEDGLLWYGNKSYEK